MPDLRRLAVIAAAVALAIAVACSNTEGHPRPVDPPPCFPNCGTGNGG